MARNYGVLPSTIIDDVRLARCGLVASLMYTLGKAVCDQYGRLPGDPETLTGKVLYTFARRDLLSDEEVQAARNALVREHLWHLYAVNGREYIEYEGHDSEQQSSILKRRGRPTYPDPPDRPDMAAASRPHNPGKRDQWTEAASQPDGSADLPPAAPVRVPSQPEAQGAVPAEGQTATELPNPKAQVEPLIPNGYAQLAKCHEKYAGRMLSTDDQRKLRAVLADAQEAGVEWQTLLTIMQEVQHDYKPTRTEPVIKGIGYYLGKWNQYIREARGEPLRYRRPVDDPDDGPPEEEVDVIALRAREQLKRLVGSHAS